MKYFKIKTGYGENDFVPIDETELESAIYIFLTDSKGIFQNGVVRGKDIIAISEDWNKAMGWNAGYKLGPDDHADIANNCKHYTGVIAEARRRVQYLISTDQVHLIGKNVQVPGLDKGYPADLQKEINNLADSKRIS